MSTKTGQVHNPTAESSLLGYPNRALISALNAAAQSFAPALAAMSVIRRRVGKAVGDSKSVAVENSQSLVSQFVNRPAFWIRGAASGNPFNAGLASCRFRLHPALDQPKAENASHQAAGTSLDCTD